MKVANLNNLMSLLLVVMLTLLAILMLPIEMMAGPVGKGAAKQKALAFLNGRAASRAGARAASVQELRLEYTSDAYHIFNCGEKGGFVIVGGDDCAPEILGYADSGTFNWQNMPDNLRAWMKGYEEDIKILRASGIKYSTNENAGRTRGSGCKTSIAPLLTSKWDQGEPYNLQTPMGYDEEKKQNVHCLTGCVATAMAQIMYYWYRKVGYESRLVQNIPEFVPQNSIYPTLELLNAPATFDWAKMTDEYGDTSTDVQKNAVAKLMKYCGYADQMKYGINESAAPSPEYQYFGYKSSITLKRSDYYYDDWQDLIYNELTNARPIYYIGAATGCAHAFVCDGYDKEDYYHINWGWGGLSDGFFRLYLMNPKSLGTGGGSHLDGYSMSQKVILCHPTEVVEPSVEHIYKHKDATIKCDGMIVPELTGGQTSNVKVTLSLANSGRPWMFSGDIIVNLQAEGQSCQIGFNVELNRGETKEIDFPLAIPANISGPAKIAVYRNSVDRYDQNMLCMENVTVGIAHTLSGSVSIYRDENTLWYKVTGNAEGLGHHNFTVKWFDYSTLKVISTNDTYELQEADRGRSIAVLIESPYYLGKLCSSAYDCYGLVNPAEPTPPSLGISQDMVYVKNSRTSQEYLIFDFQKPIVTLSESDWKNAKKPSSNNEILYLGGTKNMVNYIYTRTRASGPYIAGSLVERSHIYLGDESSQIQAIAMKVELVKVSAGGTTYDPIFDKDNDAYYINVGDVIRITPQKYPSTATFWGIPTSRWINNTGGGQFYEDKECLMPLKENESYYEVFYKTTTPMIYNEILVEYQIGANYALHDQFYLHVADVEGRYQTQHISPTAVTIGTGETRANIELSTRPFRGSLHNMTTQLTSGSGTPPVVIFDEEKRTMTVDATNATVGFFNFDVYQDSHKVNVGLTVEVTTPALESIRILDNGIQAMRGATFKVGLLLTPVNAKYQTIEWRVDDESIATITNDGTLTVKADAPMGRWTKVRVTADNSLTATCDLVVLKPTPYISFGDYEYEVWANESFSEPELYNPDNLSVCYSSSNPNVAKVDTQTGTVTLIGIGFVIISADFQGDEDFNETAASYFLTVKEPVPGDANSDGNVDAEDIKAVVNYIITGKKNGFNFDNANLNGDTKVDAADLVLLINKVNNP